MSFSRVLCVQVFRLCAIIMLRCSPRSVYIPKHFSFFEVKEKKTFENLKRCPATVFEGASATAEAHALSIVPLTLSLRVFAWFGQGSCDRAVTSTFPSSLLRSNHAPVLYAHIIVVNDLALSSQTKKKREKKWENFLKRLHFVRTLHISR